MTSVQAINEIRYLLAITGIKNSNFCLQRRPNGLHAFPEPGQSKESEQFSSNPIYKENEWVDLHHRMRKHNS